jgi:hypothetical protein
MYKEYKDKKERLINKGKKEYPYRKYECFNDFFKNYNNYEVKFFNENFKEDLFNFCYNDNDSLASTFCKRWIDTFEYIVNEVTIKDMLYYYYFNKNSKEVYYPKRFI